MREILFRGKAISRIVIVSILWLKHRQTFLNCIYLSINWLCGN